MNRDRSILLRAIRTYGASARRWPADALDVTPGPAEQEALRLEAALDDALDADRAELALRGPVRARILASAPRPGAARRSLPFAVGAWARAAGVAATLTAGVAAGFAGAATAFPAPQPEQTLLGLALSAPSDPFSAFMEDGV
jgi:hypothetical protein